MNGKRDLVVLTLGMNPLPCLVETYRICKTLRRESGAYPEILALTTDKADPKVLQEILEKRLRAEDPTAALAWRYVEIDNPFSPKEIAKNLDGLRARGLKWENISVHFPYTGGTKAVSMETLVFLMSQTGQMNEKREPAFRRYYLNPGTNQLEDEKGYSSGSDERLSWNLQLAELAELHGLHNPVLKPVNPTIEAIANSMLTVLADHNAYDVFGKWLLNWDNHCRSKNWKNTFEWCLLENNQEWNKISLNISSVFPNVFRSSNGWWEIATSAKKGALGELVHNQSLELYVYRILRDALPLRFDVRHSVRTMPKSSKTDFQLDVVAILGYQLINISCTMSGHPGTCKEKAFEAIHRARQLGGDHANALMITTLSTDEAKGVEKNIADEMGLPDEQKPITIFGVDLLADCAHQSPIKLKHRMQEYLEGLGWFLKNETEHQATV